MEWLIETLVNVSNPNCKNYCRRHDHDHDHDDHHPTLFLPNQMPFSSPTNLSIQAWPLLHGSEFPKRRRSSFGIKEDDMLSHSSGFLRLKYSSGQIIATSLQKLAEEGKSLISDKIHEQNLYYCTFNHLTSRKLLGGSSFFSSTYCWCGKKIRLTSWYGQ